MEKLQLTLEQISIADPSRHPSLFLSGVAGTGKSTAASRRLLNLALAGNPPSSILVIVPQRSLSTPFASIIQDPSFPQGSLPEIVTFGGLARRMISLFWPLISASAGFKRPHHPPAFLTLETSQYYMASIVNPMIQKGMFETVNLEPNRLFSQILDNLNKSALIGMPHTLFAKRMISSFIGDQEVIAPLIQTQTAANDFRELCFKLNLLDFSLQIEVFHKYLWPSLLFQKHLTNRYHHLIYDNIEEDAPIYHDMVKEWSPSLDTLLLIQDCGAGYRSFLGADPVSSSSLQTVAQQALVLKKSLISENGIERCSFMLQSAIHHQEFDADPLARDSFSIITCRLVPETLKLITNEIKEITSNKGIKENEIVVLAPYLSDSLLFSVIQEFNAAGINSQEHRPSRSVKSDPAVNCLITLAKLVNPQWDAQPSRYAMREVFIQLLTRGDLIRADLLAQVLYAPKNSTETLASFDNIQSDMRERIGYSIGERYMTLRAWLMDILENPVADLDVFWSRCFGELLSQKDMGFHASFSASNSIALLIESYQKFRQVMEPTKSILENQISHEYINLVESGVIASFYMEPWKIVGEGVLIAPAYTYLLTNRPVRVQFWLDIGSPGWWQRPFQPLTHPYILSRNWEEKRPWTDADESRVSTDSLSRLAAGLLQRCCSRVYFCATEFDERGSQNKTGLLQAVNTITRKFAALDLKNV